MKTHSLDVLPERDFDVRNIEIFPAVWSERKDFSQYQNTPRSTSAFFLILSNVHGTFISEDGARVSLQKGCVLYIPSQTRYTAVFSGGDADTRIDSYTVNFNLLDEWGEEIVLADHITVLAQDPNGLFDSCFHRLGESVHQASERGGNLRKKADFYALLNALHTFGDDRTEICYPIRKGMDALCREWNQNERIETYAALCGMSEGYFYRLFRRANGMSPIEYRNLLRVSNARSILKNTRLSVKEVANVVGFDDPFYFCRIFKKHTGIAPSEYRKANLGIEIPE